MNHRQVYLEIFGQLKVKPERRPVVDGGNGVLAVRTVPY